mmetsp:Transcript_28605/g.50867  ORF Transcript_28605/g.50867 Transcript_28605/m.50867 type:complete len:364 (+) Transcript_28605:534-1625(+)
MFAYDDEGSSADPCSEKYRGSNAFSEPETQVVRDFVNSKNLRLWIHYDGANDAVYRPFCYKDSDNLFTNTDDLDFYDSLKDSAYDDIESFASASTEANGKLLDWAYNKSIIALEVSLSESKPDNEEILTEVKKQSSPVQELLSTMTANFSLKKEPVLQTYCEGCAANETYYSFYFTIDNAAQAGASAVFNFDFAPYTNSTLSLYKVLTSQASYPDLNTDEYTEASVSATKLSFSLQLGSVPRRSQKYINILARAPNTKPITGVLSASVNYTTSNSFLSQGGDSYKDSELRIPEEYSDIDEFQDSVFLGQGYSVDHNEDVAVAVSTSVIAAVGLALTGLVLYCRKRSYSEQNVGFGVGRHEVKE